MEGDQSKLTLREQEYLEHVRRAREQGVTLVRYCETAGLKVRTLYGIKRYLVRKGSLPRTLAPKKSRQGKFVAVRVATPAAGGHDPVCRIRHRSGWMIECGRWPEAAWVSQLLKGGGDASA